MGLRGMVTGWFQFQLPEEAVDHHITYEVLLACAVRPGDGVWLTFGASVSASRPSRPLLPYVNATAFILARVTGGGIYSRAAFSYEII